VCDRHAEALQPVTIRTLATLSRLPP
jgi:hypothetical protein